MWGVRVPADDTTMTAAPGQFRPRRLAAWALFIGALVAAFLVFQNATPSLVGANDDADGPPMRIMSRAQSARCLTVQGLRVTSAGASSLHVTGPARIDVTLTFYPTFDQAQAAALDWFSGAQGAPRVTREGARGGAMDTVAWRSRSVLAYRNFRLFSGCVGHQPVRPSA